MLESTNRPDNTYWNKYYGASAAPVSPSQFAVFIYGELQDTNCLIDLGCGSGRDTLFFARQGVPTIGVDQSEAAIVLCQTRARDLGFEHATFLNASISDPALPEALAPLIRDRSNGKPVFLYARFVIHAITEDQEQHLLNNVAALLEVHGGYFGAEFRTNRDAHQSKVTPDHYRRFVNPVLFINAATSAGLKLTYHVEGFGYAKHKHDDAHVSRCVFTM